MGHRINAMNIGLSAILAVAGTSCANTESAGNCPEQSGGGVDADVLVQYSFDCCDVTTPEQTGVGPAAQLVGGALCGAHDELSSVTGLANPSGPSLVLDGSGDYTWIADDSLFEPDSFTVAAWIFSDDYSECTGASCSIVSKGNTDIAPTGYWLNVDTSGDSSQLRMVIAGDGSETPVRGGEVSAGAWHHVASTFDGAIAVLYVDGVPGVPVAVDHPITYGDESFLIGRMYNRTYDFQGKIDDVALWDFAKSSEEIAVLYQSYLDAR